MGTTPLIIHVPASEPIRKSISIEGMAELILLTICSRTEIHVWPSRIAITPATAEARVSAIWLAPESVSSKKFTLSERSSMSTAIGIKEAISPGLFILLVIGIRSFYFGVHNIPFFC